MPNLIKTQQKKIIRFAESNMNLEGFNVATSVKKDSIVLMRGTKSADEIVEKYIVTFKKHD